MILLNKNPFRILGVISNASLKELKSAEVTIKRYLDIGQAPVLKFDLTPPMEPINRSLGDIVKAKNQIHNPKDKLIHSIFWFISSSPIDNIALSKLTERKDIDEALETFRKGSKNFAVSEKTATSILNHTSLELLLFNNHKDETRFIDALRKKIEILSDKSIVRHFEFLVTGDKDKVEYIDVKDGVFEHVKSILTDVFPNKNHTKLLLSILPSNSSFKQEIEEGVVSDIIKRISVENNKFDNIFEANKADKSSKLKKVNKTQANKILEAGRSLVEDTKSSFKELNKYIDKSDYQFENILNEAFSRANAAIIYLYNAELNYKIGSSLLFTNQKEFSFSYLKKARELSEDLPNDFLFYYGMTLQLEGEYGKAMEQFELFRNTAKKKVLKQFEVLTKKYIKECNCNTFI